MDRAVEFGPGLVRVGASRGARYERQRQEKLAAYQLMIAETAGRPAVQKGPRKRAQVVREGWSGKARSRMLRTFLGLDMSPLLRPDGQLSMVTLTLPAPWEPLAPTGEAWAGLLRRYFARLDRAWPGWGAGLVKTEFQPGRGAPHCHVLCAAPPGVGAFGRGKAKRMLPYKQWVSLTWADVVGASGPARVAHESAGTQVKRWEGPPERAVLYFLKYTQKSGPRRHKQDVPPELWRKPGAGLARVWSHRGLSSDLVEVPVSDSEAVWAQRTLRRWHDAQRSVNRFRVPRGAGARLVTRRAKRLRTRGGWLAVSDGPKLGLLCTEAAQRIVEGSL